MSEYVDRVAPGNTVIGNKVSYSAENLLFLRVACPRDMSTT